MNNLVVFMQLGPIDIQTSVLAVAGLTATSLAIGFGIPASFVFAGGAMKKGKEMSLGFLGKVGRGVAAPIKGAAKVVGRETVADVRDKLASEYDPTKGNTGRNLVARLAGGAIIPSKRSNLKLASRVAKYESSQAQNANALLKMSGIDTGEKVADIIGKGGAPGIDMRDPDITRQLTALAIKDGSGKALHLMYGSDKVNHDVMGQEIRRNFIPARSASAGIAYLAGDADNFKEGAGQGNISGGAMSKDSASYKILASEQAKNLGNMSTGVYGGQDTESLRMATDVIEDMQSGGSKFGGEITLSSGKKIKPIDYSATGDQDKLVKLTATAADMASDRTIMLNNAKPENRALIDHFATLAPKKTVPQPAPTSPEPIPEKEPEDWRNQSNYL
jgi:hypothetical protein